MATTMTPSPRTMCTLIIGAAGGIAVMKLLEIYRNKQNNTNAIPNTNFGNKTTLLTKPKQLHDGDFVDIIDEHISIDQLIKKVETPKCGAIVTFSGVTRDNFEGKEVLHLEYEGFCDMGIKELSKICKEIRTRWEVEHIAIVHKVGRCLIGEASVVIAVSSAHRKEAIEACRFAIDTLKATVPIWKKEFYGEGSTWKENKEWRAEKYSKTSSSNA